MKRHAIRIPLALLAVLALAGASFAQNPPVFRGGSPGSLRYEVNRDFHVLIDGQPLTTATCYTSRGKPGVILIDASVGGAIYTRISDRKVLSVNPLDIRIDGDVLTLPGESAFGELVTDWTLDGSAAEFTMKGRKIRIEPRPILLGTATAEQVLEQSPSYRHLMSLYQPDAEALSFLKRFDQTVDVEVYFGTWCHVCKKYLPQLLRTITECDNENIQATFYGLPRKFSSDARAQEKKITGIPCVIVSKDGREIGRIEGPPRLSYEKDLGGLFRLAAAR